MAHSYHITYALSELGVTTRRFRGKASACRITRNRQPIEPQRHPLQSVLTQGFVERPPTRTPDPNCIAGDLVSECLTEVQPR